MKDKPVAAGPGSWTKRQIVESGPAVLGRRGAFARLNETDRACLFAHGHVRKFAANERIFPMGSPGDSMAAVLNGGIRISVPSSEGKDVVLAMLGPGEICGEIALFDGKERSADATAATDCTVLLLQRQEVLAFFAQHPAALRQFIDVLCDRLRAADRHMAELAMAPVSVRLANALLRLATSDGYPVHGRAVERVHLTQRELGNVVGTSRECVNRYLRDWQRRGCVQIISGVVVITDRTAMEDLAEEEV